MVASVAVISAVHSTKTTPATSPLAALVDPGLVDLTATLGYQQAISAGTGMVLTPSSRVMTNNDVIEGAPSITVTDVGNHRTYQATVTGYDQGQAGQAHTATVVFGAGPAG